LFDHPAIQQQGEEQNRTHRGGRRE
jgi:hypothetical protein